MSNGSYVLDLARRCDYKTRSPGQDGDVRGRGGPRWHPGTSGHRGGGFHLKRYGCFYKLGVPFVGVLITKALLFGVYVRAPDFLETPKSRITAGSLCRSLPVDLSRSLYPLYPFMSAQPFVYALTFCSPAVLLLFSFLALLCAA